MQNRFQNFTVLIMKINRFIHKIKTEEMAEYNLKSPHVSCLYYLSKAEPLSAKELCDMCEEDKATMSRSTEYLEKNGYIVCDSDAGKRYKAQFSLTDKGRVIARGISDKIDSVLDVAGDGLSEEKRTAMYESLALVCDNLEKICKNYEE